MACAKCAAAAPAVANVSDVWPTRIGTDCGCDKTIQDYAGRRGLNALAEMAALATELTVPTHKLLMLTDIKEQFILPFIRKDQAATLRTIYNYFKGLAAQGRMPSIAELKSAALHETEYFK